MGNRAGFAIIMMLALAGCARPPGVPQSASFEMNAEGDSGWRWKRTLRSGCLEWLADENLASVQLSTNPNDCEGGKGLSYVTVEHGVTFRNYWSWTPEEYDKLIIFNNSGMVVGTRPCPHTLPKKEIETLRAVLAEALGQVITDAERRSLRRVDYLLTLTDGAALGSYQAGCTAAFSIPGPDVWTDR